MPAVYSIPRYNTCLLFFTFYGLALWLAEIQDYQVPIPPVGLDPMTPASVQSQDRTLTVIGTRTHPITHSPSSQERSHCNRKVRLCGAHCLSVRATFSAHLTSFKMSHALLDAEHTGSKISASLNHVTVTAEGKGERARGSRTLVIASAPSPYHCWMAADV
jgi:hypothetical protein